MPVELPPDHDPDAMHLTGHAEFGAVLAAGKTTSMTRSAVIMAACEKHDMDAVPMRITSLHGSPFLATLLDSELSFGVHPAGALCDRDARADRRCSRSEVPSRNIWKKVTVSAGIERFHVWTGGRWCACAFASVR